MDLPSHQTREVTKDSSGLPDAHGRRFVSVCCCKITRPNEEKTEDHKGENEDVGQVGWEAGYEECEGKDRPY